MSDCQRGCRDGEIWVRDPDGTERMRLCACQRGRSGFSTDYSPGGRSKRARFRRLQSWRGKRSAVKRRQLAKGRPPRRRERTREIALANAYPRVRRISRQDFDRLYRTTAERAGWLIDPRGMNTAWALYRAVRAWYDVCGQGFECTNLDLQKTLTRYGRSRSRRTVQTTRKRLEAMGLFDFAWVKRGTWQKNTGWIAGAKADTIRVTVQHVRVSHLRRRVANCTPPTGAATSGLRPSVSRSPGVETQATSSAANGLSPPAAPAGDRQTAESAIDQELERQIAFYELKLSSGFGDQKRVKADLWRVRAELRRLRQGPEPPGQSSDRIASRTSEGLM